MNNTLSHLNQLFFLILPYVAFFTFFLVTIYRYRAQAFTYSSLSSQFLENQDHFWGMVPFHYGILVVLAGHLIAFLIPDHLLAFNRAPLRLYILEISGLIFAFLTLAGLTKLLVRRFNNVKIKEITSAVDWILYFLLLFQVIGGIYVTIFHRWGSSWFAATLAPYLWSLLKLNPDISFVVGMPLMVKLHIINAFIIIGFFPFTRLVHVLVIPNPYLWRKKQVVRWYRNYRSTRTTV
ncbi:MAG: respiratory nitrate reductase subunit gamma [candidate division Zixibacteria bacterium]